MVSYLKGFWTFVSVLEGRFFKFPMFQWSLNCAAALCVVVNF